MPPLQTTFGNMAPAFIGMRANTETRNAITGIAEEVIAFGQPVMQGTEDKQVLVYDGSGAYLGITEANIVLPTEDYQIGDNVPVDNYGVIWVEAGGACTIRGAVGWDDTTGQYSDGGAIAIPGASFDSTATTAGELVRIRLVPVESDGSGS